VKISRLLITAPAAALAAYGLARGLRRTVHHAVTTALAEERERELAESSAFWRDQEAREDALTRRDLEADALLEHVQIPEQDLARALDEQGMMDPEFARALRDTLEDMAAESTAGGLPAPTGPPDPQRHPANPDWTPNTANQVWTDERLATLCESGVALADIRPGPMGTLDLYVFEDETTLCVIPGDREVTHRLLDSLRAGTPINLLGGSCMAGAYTLTFSVGEDSVFLLADRVIASA
jgi:hypothetical protein